MRKYTKNHIAILEYVKRNGQVNVHLTPEILHQNKNFYNRVRLLEMEGALIVDRSPGETSIFAITNVGLDILAEFRPLIETDLDELVQGIEIYEIISMIKKSDYISKHDKEKIERILIKSAME